MARDMRCYRKEGHVVQGTKVLRASACDTCVLTHRQTVIAAAERAAAKCETLQEKYDRLDIENMNLHMQLKKSVSAHEALQTQFVGGSISRKIAWCTPNEISGPYLLCVGTH